MQISKLLIEILYGIVGFFIICLFVLILFIQSVYWYDVSTLPIDKFPAVPEYSQTLVDVLWLSSSDASDLQSSKEPYMESLSPLGFIFKIVFAPSDSAKMPLSGSIVRILLGKFDPPEDKVLRRNVLRQIALMLWISQHWTARQVLNTRLHLGYYGHDYFGITAAAQGYFDKSPEQLTVQESFLLVGLSQAPSRLEPYCHAVQLIERTNYLIRIANSWEKYAHLTPLNNLPVTLQNKVAARNQTC